jgi:hypothetical protein
MTTQQEGRSGVTETRTFFEWLRDEEKSPHVPQDARVGARRPLSHSPDPQDGNSPLDVPISAGGIRRTRSDEQVAAESPMRLSDDFMRDARSDAQSTRGRIDCAFESGYFAMLSLFTPEERKSVEHPSLELLDEAARRLNIDPEPGILLGRTRYAANDEERLSLEEALSWANAVREAVTAG